MQCAHRLAKTGRIAVQERDSSAREAVRQLIVDGVRFRADRPANRCDRLVPALPCHVADLKAATKFRPAAHRRAWVAYMRARRSVARAASRPMPGHRL